MLLERANEFGDRNETLVFPEGDITPKCIDNLFVEVDDVVQVRSFMNVFIVTTTFQGVTSEPIIGGGIVISPDATVAEDYQVGLTMVTFDENTDDQMECVILEISNDTNFEGAETLTVQLDTAQLPLSIDPDRNVSTITILDLDANCGPPPPGDGVSPAPSNPPYGIDASGMLVANPGAVATYTCDDPDNQLNFMGSAQLTCTIIEDGISVGWVPAEAPTCTEPTEPTAEPIDPTMATSMAGVTEGAPSTHGSVTMYITCAALCLGQFIAYFI